MFKSNPANTTVSSCVPHEPPVQILVVIIVIPPSPGQVIWAAFWWRSDLFLIGANWKVANIQWSDTSVNHTVNWTVSSYRDIVTAHLRGLPIKERVKASTFKEVITMLEKQAFRLFLGGRGEGRRSLFGTTMTWNKITRLLKKRKHDEKFFLYFLISGFSLYDVKVNSYCLLLLIPRF